MKRGVSLAAALAFAASALGESPLSPEDALRSFELADGLAIELVAAEPLVASPCAMAFDERGRLFVVENRGYPNRAEPPQGVVALLEDTDNDGRMDKRTDFAGGLAFPNGVMPWRGGVFVTAAPDVLYFKDTDGDGVADERRVVLTGFDTSKSTQLRVNAPLLGPDGWVWLASGLTGGKIRNPAHPEFGELELKTDLRFDPHTGRFEAVDGRSQYGHTFNETGQRFICMNRVPVQHVVLSQKALARNPHLAFSETVQDCNERAVKTGLKGGGDGVRLYSISKNITTADSHAGSFSAACAITIWRGGALPEKFDGAALSCDPTANLVHADKLTPRGATFSAEPLLKERELLASRDDWFRPVFLSSGPDGALYVADMYRKVIEHPDYLPEAIRKRTDFDNGKNMGRIWRISAARRPPRAHSKPLNGDEPGGLIAALASGTPWECGVAARLLIERPNSSSPDAFAKEFANCKSPHGQIALLQTAAAIDGPAQGGDDAALRGLLRAGYGAADARVREVAVSLRPVAIQDDFNLERIRWWIRLVEDPNPRVRFQFALQAKWEGPKRENRAMHLSDIALRGADDRWTRAAVLSGVADNAFGLLACFRSGKQKSPDTDGRLALVEETARAAAATAKQAGKDFELQFFTTYFEHESFDFRAAVTVGTAEGLQRRIPVNDLAAEAIALLANDKTPAARKVCAIRVLALADWMTAGEPLLALAGQESSPELRLAAIRVLAAFETPEAPAALLAPERWSGATPQVREAILSGLLSRKSHQLTVLDAIEAGVVSPDALTAQQKKQLRESKAPEIRERSAKLFVVAHGDRQAAFEKAKAALALTANPPRGREVFKNLCATCHRLDREGVAVGPDLFDMRNQPKESILLHIVNPDAEVAPGFAAWLVETKDGRSFAGIVTSETPAGISLRQPGGAEETIARNAIASLTPSPHSLMPPGLEAAMTPPQLADLLAWLRGEE